MRHNAAKMKTKMHLYIGFFLSATTQLHFSNYITRSITFSTFAYSASMSLSRSAGERLKDLLTQIDTLRALHP